MGAPVIVLTDPRQGLAPYAQFAGTRIVKTAKPLPQVKLHNITSLSVNRSSFGAIGTARIGMSIADNPILATGNATATRRGSVLVKIFGGFNLDTAGNPTENAVIFTGIYDYGDYGFHDDSFEMNFRDNGSVCQERTVQPRAVSTETSVHNYISQLAAEANLSVGYVSPTLGQDGVTPLKVGSFFSGSHSLLKAKHTVWGTLEHLAKVSGNVVYFTMDGKLYFGPRGTRFATGYPNPPVRKQFVFSLNGYSNFIELTLTHQPARHSAFVNQVASHDRSTGISKQYTTSFINGNLLSDLGLGDQDVIYQGNTTAEIQSLLNQGSGTNGIPVYDIYVEGKQQDECYAQSLAQTRETAAQERVLKGTMLGTVELDVGDPVVITGTGHPLVDGRPFTTVGVHYEFDLERGWLLHPTFWAEDVGLGSLITAQ